jgi:SAM-dependent methyltransferase
MNDHFSPDAFDLAVGAAILHHILDVQKTLGSVHKALRKGGSAIFFEPFEAGNAILRMAYQHILERASSRPLGKQLLSKSTPSLSSEITAFLKRRIAEFDRRISPELHLKKQLDDKWYFTRSYFEKKTAELGFSSLRILPNHSTDRPLIGPTLTFLRNGMGVSRDALPTFAWEILESYEDAMSCDLKRDMMTTGTIILTK